MRKNTKRPRGNKKWLSDGGEIKLGWVKNYIKNHPATNAVISDPFTGNTFEDLLEIIEKLSDAARGVQVIEDMKSDWRLKKYEENENNKRFSTTLSPNTVKLIDSIAERECMTRRETIEWLVKDFRSMKAEMRQENRDATKEKLKDLNALVETKTKRLQEKLSICNNQCVELRENLSEKEKIIKAQSKTMKTMVYDLAYTNTIIERLPEEERTLFPLEKAKVAEKQSLLSHYYKQQKEKLLNMKKLNYQLENKAKN